MKWKTHVRNTNFPVWIVDLHLDECLSKIQLKIYHELNYSDHTAYIWCDLFIDKWYQQQPPPFLPEIFLLAPGLILVEASWAFLLGALVETLPFISLVIVVKASSTLSDSFADVSKNRTLKWSASSFAS